jgi:hypothetical protein
MAATRPDLEFPACCAHCPYLRPVTASCTHELRQSLIRGLGGDRTCPGYSAAKTRAMRRLSDSL